MAKLFNGADTGGSNAGGNDAGGKNFSGNDQARRRRDLWLLAASVIGGSAIGIATFATSAASGASSPTATEVSAALARRLPKTVITAVSCDKLGGLCEVTAGNTLFYTDAKARLLIIGRVYDMETRTDLTAAKLLALNTDTLLGSAAHNEADKRQAAPARPAAPAKVALGELPAAGAIRWGPVGGLKAVVFTDFRCPYCARLSEALGQIGARVEERPISVLGTRALTEKVYCAKDPVAALHSAYRHEEPADSAAGANAKCDVSGLDVNEAFARAHGFAGTPVVVRADGAVIEGWRPAAELAAFLKGQPA